MPIASAPHLKGDLDFSFSGLKTAVLRTSARERRPLQEQEIADIARSFPARRRDALIERLFERARRFRRRASASPAACRRTAGCAPSSGRGARREIPTFLPSLRSRPTTRR
jgi:hypothetical protein